MGGKRCFWYELRPDYDVLCFDFSGDLSPIEGYSPRNFFSDSISNDPAGGSVLLSLTTARIYNLFRSLNAGNSSKEPKPKGLQRIAESLKKLNLKR